MPVPWQRAEKSRVSRTVIWATCKSVWLMYTAVFCGTNSSRLCPLYVTVPLTCTHKNHGVFHLSHYVDWRTAQLVQRRMFRLLLGFWGYAWSYVYLRLFRRIECFSPANLCQACLPMPVIESSFQSLGDRVTMSSCKKVHRLMSELHLGVQLSYN